MPLQFAEIDSYVLLQLPKKILILQTFNSLQIPTSFTKTKLEDDTTNLNVAK